MSADTALLERMPAELRERWLATSPALVESCLRLDAIGPGPSLVHGDFHPWNVVYGPGTTRVFDWSDAAVSHPFVDLATYVFRTEDISMRRRTGRRVHRCMVDRRVGRVTPRGRSPGAGRRSAVPGAELPCAPADVDGKRCGRRLGRCRPGLDQPHAHPSRAGSGEPELTSPSATVAAPHVVRRRTTNGYSDRHFDLDPNNRPGPHATTPTTNRRISNDTGVDTTVSGPSDAPEAVVVVVVVVVFAAFTPIHAHRQDRALTAAWADGVRCAGQPISGWSLSRYWPGGCGTEAGTTSALGR